MELHVYRSDLTDPAEKKRKMGELSQLALLAACVWVALICISDDTMVCGECDAAEKVFSDACYGSEAYATRQGVRYDGQSLFYVDVVRKGTLLGCGETKVARRDMWACDALAAKVESANKLSVCSADRIKAWHGIAGLLAALSAWASAPRGRTLV